MAEGDYVQCASQKTDVVKERRSEPHLSSHHPSIGGWDLEAEEQVQPPRNCPQTREQRFQG